MAKAVGKPGVLVPKDGAVCPIFSCPVTNAAGIKDHLRKTHKGEQVYLAIYLGPRGSSSSIHFPLNLARSKTASAFNFHDVKTLEEDDANTDKDREAIAAFKALLESGHILVAPPAGSSKSSFRRQPRRGRQISEGCLS